MTDSYRLRTGRVVAVERTIGYANGGPPTFQAFEWRDGGWTPTRTWGGPGFIPVERPAADLTAEPYYVAVANAVGTKIPARGICRTFPRR